MSGSHSRFALRHGHLSLLQVSSNLVRAHWQPFHLRWPGRELSSDSTIISSGDQNTYILESSGNCARSGPCSDSNHTESDDRRVPRESMGCYWKNSSRVAGGTSKSRLTHGVKLFGSKSGVVRLNKYGKRPNEEFTGELQCTMERPPSLLLIGSINQAGRKDYSSLIEYLTHGQQRMCLRQSQNALRSRAFGI